MPSDPRPSPLARVLETHARDPRTRVVVLTGSEPADLTNALERARAELSVVPGPQWARESPDQDRWRVADVQRVLDHLATQSAHGRVIVLDRLESADSRALDRLLLPLEEAPATLWILVSLDPTRLSSTIRSRVSRTVVVPSDLPTIPLAPSATPALDARAIVAGLAATRAAQRTAVARLLLAWRHQLADAVVGVGAPADLQRLVRAARALDAAHLALDYSADPALALTGVLAALGRDPLPAAADLTLREADPIPPFTAVLAPSTIDDGLSLGRDPAPPVDVPRWSPGPPWRVPFLGPALA